MDWRCSTVKFTMQSHKRVLSLCVVLICTVVLFGISFGSVKLTLSALFSPQNAPILHLRLTRVILALVAGAGLAVAGVIFQGILRNPLAEPYVLGVSSGAGLGAVVALSMNLALTYLPFISFAGAVLTMCIVYQMAKINGYVSTQGLLLSGVIVSAVFSSLLLFFVSVSSNEAMHGITWWLLGSLQVWDTHLLAVAGIVICAGVLVALYFGRDLNAISLGDEEAHHLGIKVALVKKILFIIASLITASIVSVCGIIGFVGLIIPHAVRLWCGSDHRIVLPASALCAGSFLILADTLSRSVMPPLEIPIGVVTALMGGPLFVILLRKKQKSCP